MAWVTPPTYWSTGAHLSTSRGSNALVSSFGERKRRKYHELSTKVSIVSASRRAGDPSTGFGTFTQSVAPPSGEVPFGVRFRPSVGGSSTGSWSSGTGYSA